MKDGADLSHLEDFKLALLLNLFVHPVVVGHFFHGGHLVGVFEGATELTKYLVTGVDYEFQVCTAALFVEQEDEFVIEAEPVKEHHSGANQSHVVVLCLIVRDVHARVSFIVIVLHLVRVIVLPDHLYDPDQEIHASLECLDSAQLWNVRRIVEVFDPTAQVHDQGDPAINTDSFRSDHRESFFELVREGNDVSQIDKVGDLKTGLTEERARSTDAGDVPNDRRSALIKHVFEQVDCLVLEGQEGAHLGGQAAWLRPCIRCLCILHEHLQESHVGVTGG